MSETNITFGYLYKAAREFYEKKDYNKAFDFYKAALQIRADYAVVWQEAGYTLMKMQRMAEAGIYFRKALTQYDQDENIDIPIDKRLYLKACLCAILEEKNEAILHLKEAVKINPELMTKVMNESDFNVFMNDEDFINFINDENNTIENDNTIIIENQTEADEMNEIEVEIANEIEIANETGNYYEEKNKNYRGALLQKSDLNEMQLLKRNIVVEILQNKNWNNTHIEQEFEENKAVAPQVMFVYHNNPNFEIYLSYYIEENYIFLDLLNKNQRSENQICKLKATNLGEIIEKVIESQDQISDENWTDLLGQFIDICEEVVLEMPDGRQVKI